MQHREQWVQRRSAGLSFQDLTGCRFGCCEGLQDGAKTNVSLRMLLDSSSDIARLHRELQPSHPLHHPTPLANMSLVSGPGRAGMANMPEEMQLFVDKHVRYIQSLDTVRTPMATQSISNRSPR
jgi:hypothetical protein